MNNNKIVFFQGKRVCVGQIKHWSFDERLDMADKNPLNQKRWECLQTLVRVWTTRDTAPLKDILSPSFSYSSAWVKESLEGPAAYIDYLSGKFETLAKTRSDICVEVVTLREALHPQFYSYALLITQDQKIQVIVGLAFKEDRIESMSMADPEIYTYDRRAVI